jgi:hypothetical protein
MRKLEINGFIQIAGMFGLIGSLTFVGLQMNQTQIIALGEQTHHQNALQTHRGAPERRHSIANKYLSIVQ